MANRQPEPWSANHLHLSCGTCCIVCWRSVQRVEQVWWSENWLCGSEPAFCHCSEIWSRGSGTSSGEPQGIQACRKLQTLPLIKPETKTQITTKRCKTLQLLLILILSGEPPGLAHYLLEPRRPLFCLKQHKATSHVVQMATATESLNTVSLHTSDLRWLSVNSCLQGWYNSDYS